MKVRPEAKQQQQKIATKKKIEWNFDSSRFFANFQNLARDGILIDVDFCQCLKKCQGQRWVKCQIFGKKLNFDSS